MRARGATTPRRSRGFTLVELMIALALTGMVTTSVLLIARTQLLAYEMNDQIVRTQQNARAAMDFLENIARRACGGINSGGVGINVPGVPQTLTTCLRWYDGAQVASGSFSTGSAGAPDALEVVYASGAMTALTAPPVLTASPSVTVADTSHFAVGDYVLVGDFQNADLFRISGIQAAGSGSPRPGTLQLGTLSAVVVSPVGLVLTTGAPVLKATTYSMFVAPAGSGYDGMLMLDPDGVASANHLDYTRVQPAVDGIVDFQVAIGIDGDADGLIREDATAVNGDEWTGNVAGELLPALPWNPAAVGNAPPPPPQLQQLRLGLLLQTMNQYAGAPPTVTPLEDRPAASYPTRRGSAPRYRSVRAVVAPRAWNLNE